MRTWTKRGEVIEALRAESGLRVKNRRRAVYRWGDGPECLESGTGNWLPTIINDGPWTEVIAKPEPRRAEPRRAGPYVQCTFDEADEASSEGEKRVAFIGHVGDWDTGAAFEGKIYGTSWFWARLDRGGK